MIYSGSLPPRVRQCNKEDLRVIKWLGIALILASMALIGCGGNLPNGAVAKVGQTYISSDQYDKLEAAYKDAGRVPDKSDHKSEYVRFRQGLAQYLVTIEILKQKGATYRVNVTDEDVQRELNIVKGMFDGSEDRFNQALKAQNLSMDELTESIRDQLWIDRMKSAVTYSVSVSDDEAKAYYEAHKSEFVQPEQRDTSHILISPYHSSGTGDDTQTATQEDWDAALAEAERIRGEIQSSTDFSIQAKQYSDDTATKDSGGELGLITRGQMAAAFEDAVFSLKKNQVSQPVKTQYGYHLIIVTDIIPATQLTYDAASETIKGTLMQQKTEQAWESWLAEQERALGVAYRSGFQPAARTTGPTTLAGALTTTTTKVK